MKNFLATTITAGAMAASALVLAGQAAAAPIGPSNVTTTVDSLDENDGGSQNQRSDGPNEATPPQISNGFQNGPYGPFGDTPPVGD